MARIIIISKLIEIIHKETKEYIIERLFRAMKPAERAEKKIREEKIQGPLKTKIVCKKACKNKE